MHPSFEEHIDDLDVLLRKTRAAREGAYFRVGRKMPPKPIRFQITGESFGMFRVKDLVTGKTRAFREHYESAHDLALQFEEQFNRAG